MSNKHKPVIPKKARGLTFNSLEDMGKALGIKPEPTPEPPKRTCAVCHSVMRYIPGTNVWVCDGTKEDGNPCTKRLISNPKKRTDKPDDNPKPDFKSGDKNKDNRPFKPKKDKFNKGKPSGKPAQATA